MLPRVSVNERYMRVARVQRLSEFAVDGHGMPYAKKAGTNIALVRSARGKPIGDASP